MSSERPEHPGQLGLPIQDHKLPVKCPNCGAKQSDFEKSFYGWICGICGHPLDVKTQKGGESADG